MNAKVILMISAVLVLVWETSWSWAVVNGQVDDFQTGATLGWGGGQGDPPSVVPSGGPAGPADSYLRITTPEVPFHLGTRNNSQWSGDYLAASITTIEMDLTQIFGSQDILIRIMLIGPGGGFSSNNNINISDATWSHYVFGLTAYDLVYVPAQAPGNGGDSGTGILSDTLSNVTKLLIRHDPSQHPTPIGGHPQHFYAELGIDNITAGIRGDVDLDGDRDADDIDRIYAEFANPTTWNPADLDFDGDTDQDDVTKLVQDLLNTDYGDANLDGSVDLADFNAWLTGSPGDGWAGGDFNGEGSIDLADFNIWLTTVPPFSPGGVRPVSVPEPVSFVLLGMFALIVRRP